MYSPTGYGFSEVGDVEAFAAGDELHLFHLTLPNHDVVQHAVSRDGLSWRPLPAALRTGDPGDCDDDQIWTMSVTDRGDGVNVMVYTALASAEGGRVQRTAVATSPDLIRWTKVAGTAVAEADPRWYETDPDVGGRVSWRDPKPIKVGDAYFATVAARERDGPPLRRGCVGLMASPDLESWEVRPPLFAPRRYWDLECPQVFEVGGAFYLTAGIMEDRTQRYWRADRFEGPYEVPADGGVLAPLGHYAGRVCRWQERDLYLCWHDPYQQTRSWGSAFPKRSSVHPDIDWAPVRNPFGKLVVPPLELEARPDGSLARRSFSGWSGYRAGALGEPSPAATATDGRRGQPGWRVDPEAGGMGVLPSEEIGESFVLSASLTLEGARGGLAFHLDGDAGGYFVEIDAGSTEARLLKWLSVPNPTEAGTWFRYAELQHGRLAAPVSRGKPVRLVLLVVGPYIECSVDGEVVLATVSGERDRGNFGIWSDGGGLIAADVRWAPMRVPAHG